MILYCAVHTVLRFRMNRIRTGQQYDVVTDHRKNFPNYTIMVQYIQYIFGLLRDVISLIISIIHEIHEK